MAGDGRPQRAARRRSVGAPPFLRANPAASRHQQVSGPAARPSRFDFPGARRRCSPPLLSRRRSQSLVHRRWLMRACGFSRTAYVVLELVDPRQEEGDQPPSGIYTRPCEAKGHRSSREGDRTVTT